MTKKEDLQLFILRDENGNEIDEACFFSKKDAIAKLPEVYKNKKYELISENELLAERYLPRIKAAKPTLRKSGIVMDMDNAIFIRNGATGEYYTYIPFTHYGEKFCFRETANKEWVEKVA